MKLKCSICEDNFESAVSPHYRLSDNTVVCPNCQKIGELKEMFLEFDSRSCDSANSEVSEDNQQLDAAYDVVNDFVDRINFVREFLYAKIGAHLKILDSISNNQDIFWKESGDLPLFVFEGSFQYVVIKLKEFIGSKSKYSLGKIKNILLDNCSRFSKKIEMHGGWAIDETKSAFAQRHTIKNYVDKVDEVTKKYEATINAIKKLRDKRFAHLDAADVSSYYSELNCFDLKRIFNLLKIIYDGFLYLIAPDEYCSLIVPNNLQLVHLNNLAKFWSENRKSN